MSQFHRGLWPYPWEVQRLSRSAQKTLLSLFQRQGFEVLSSKVVESAWRELGRELPANSPELLVLGRSLSADLMVLGDVLAARVRDDQVEVEVAMSLWDLRQDGPPLRLRDKQRLTCLAPNPQSLETLAGVAEDALDKVASRIVAQLLQGVPIGRLAWLGFRRSVELTSPHYAQKVLSELNNALLEHHLRVTPPVRVEEVLGQLRVPFPFDKEDLALIGETIPAPLLVTGRIEELRMSPEETTVKLSLAALERGLPATLFRSFASHTSSRAGRRQLSTDVQVEEALEGAARKAVKNLLDQLGVRGLILRRHEDGILVSLGQAVGLHPGAEMVVLQDGDIIARLEATQVYSTESVARFVDSTLGREPHSNDVVRLVSNPEILPELPRPKAKNKSDWAAVLLLLGGLVWAGTRGDKKIYKLMGPPDNLVLSISRTGELVNQIEFTWSVVPQASNYTLTLSGPNDPGFTLALYSIDVTAPVASFPDILIPELQDGAVYFWKVQAATPRGIRTLGTRRFTVQRINQPPWPTDPPSIPTGLGVQTQIDQLILAWNLNPEKDLKEYRIYRRVDHPDVPTAADGAFPYAVVSPQTTSYIDRNVTADHTYFYRLTALNLSGQESAPSIPAQGRPGQPKVQLLAPAQGQVLLPQQKVVTGTEETRRTTIQFGWAPTANASRYLFELARDEAITRLLSEEFVPASSTPTHLVTRELKTAIGALVGVENFYWRVTAVKDDNVVIDQSQVWPVTLDWDG